MQLLYFLNQILCYFKEGTLPFEGQPPRHLSGGFLRLFFAGEKEADPPLSGDNPGPVQGHSLPKVSTSPCPAWKAASCAAVFRQSIGLSRSIFGSLFIFFYLTSHPAHEG